MFSFPSPRCLSDFRMVPFPLRHSTVVGRFFWNERTDWTGTGDGLLTHGSWKLAEEEARWESGGLAGRILQARQGAWPTLMAEFDLDGEISVVLGILDYQPHEGKRHEVFPTPSPFLFRTLFGCPTSNLLRRRARDGGSIPLGTGESDHGHSTRDDCTIGSGFSRF